MGILAIAIGAIAVSGVEYYERKKQAEALEEYNEQEEQLKEQQIELSRQHSIAAMSRFSSGGGDAAYVNEGANLDVEQARVQADATNYAIQSSAGLGFFNFAASALGTFFKFGEISYGGTGNFVGALKSKLGFGSAITKAAPSAIAASASTGGDSYAFSGHGDYLANSMSFNTWPSAFHTTGLADIFLRGTDGMSGGFAEDDELFGRYTSRIA